MKKQKPRLLLELENNGIDILQVIHLKGKEKKEMKERVDDILCQVSIKSYLEKHFDRLIEEFKKEVLDKQK